MPTYVRDVGARGVMHQHPLSDENGGDHSSYTRWHWPWEQHRNTPGAHLYHRSENPSYGLRYLSVTRQEQYQVALSGHVYVEWRLAGRPTRSRRRAVGGPVRIDPSTIGPRIDVVTPIPTSIDDRRFGVEIECIGPRDLVVQKAQEKGLVIREEDYNHVDHNYWKIVSDGSLAYHGGRPGYRTMELVSPPLVGPTGLESLRLACEALGDLRFIINKTCGLHVHLDAAGLNVDHVKNLVRSYSNAQETINRIMPPSRRTIGESSPYYCSAITRMELNRVLSAQDVRQAVAMMRDRYRTVNLQAYSRHGTIEFRQHGGSVDYQKISHWVSFLQHLVQASRRNIVLSQGAPLAEICSALSLPAEVERYLLARERQYFPEVVLEERVGMFP